MRRRSFLAMAGVSATTFAGCLSDGLPLQSNSNPSLDRGTVDDKGEFRTVQLVQDAVELDTPDRRVAASVNGNVGPESLDVAVKVKFLHTADTTAPTRLRVMAANLSDTETELPANEIPAFSIFEGEREGGDERLVLAPVGHDAVSSKLSGGCWRASGVPTSNKSGMAVLSANEYVAQECVLLDHPEGDDCMTPGRYTFGSVETGVELSVHVWRTKSSLSDGHSQFHGVDVTDIGDYDRTAWFHEAEASTDIYLEPSAEFAEPGDELEFVLHNRTIQKIDGNKCDWAVYKLVDGKWVRIEPEAVCLPLTIVGPGGTYSWAHTVEQLGGGMYAFRTPWSRERNEHSVAYAALFNVDAEPVTVEPDSEVKEVSRDSDVLTVQSDEYADAERPVVVTAQRVDANADTQLVPPEVAVRRYSMRNTLPFFESGVREVRLKTADTASLYALGRYDEGDAIEYKGETFTITETDE